ncbi:hypothetical protein [Aeromicrobium sp. WCS2018Hpa-33]|uniref:hypothetical protein n=1 Tax=Aeromicrobium sp. WCS2018Hpa-33 TaxID=3073629 RepID=UPI0028833198|nr:hypothetical protein [Aeromicrobium sp. WCS2018Hpa-33]
MSTTIPTEISAFAARVRAQLADLPADELEELTEGLEADLAEAYAEDLARELPDPVAYAAELRAAAGLPLKEDQRSGLAGGLDSLRQGASETWRDVTLALRRSPVGRGVLDFLSVLQPVWWVTRAWLATWLVSAFFGWESGFAPTTLGTWILLAAFVTVSVQWGRGLWGAPRIGPLLVLGNVVAAVALLPVVATAQSWETSTYEMAYIGSGDPAGISLDGSSVTNIYPYDAQGRPLSGVQLFDQDGRALAPALNAERDECANDCVDGIAADGTAWAPATLETGQDVMNVYPLSVVQHLVDEIGSASSAVVGEAKVPEAPFLKVPALAPAPEASASPSAAPSTASTDAPD